MKKLILRFHVGVLTVILIPLICSQASAEGILQSKPLWGFKNLRISLAIPSGWKLHSRDEDWAWQCTSFAFEIIKLQPEALPVGKHKRLYLEILNYMTGRAITHGDLRGRPFKSTSGLHGIIHFERREQKSVDWYYTIPVPDTERSIIVRICGLSGSLESQERFAHVVYRTVQLIPAPARTEALLISPPLQTIQMHRLSLALPRGWALVYRDPDAYWRTAAFDFEIMSTLAGVPSVSRRRSVVALEVLNLPMSGARRRGHLTGIPFATKSGLRGIVHRKCSVDGLFDWYFAIPIHETDKTITIRITDLSGGLKVQNSFAYGLFGSIRFVK